MQLDDIKIEFQGIDHRVIKKIKIEPSLTETALEEQKRTCIQGFSQSPKRIHLKYCYDQEGVRVYDKILASKQYYLVRSETNIFKKWSNEIAKLVNSKQFALVDLGVGEGSKSLILAQEGTKMELKVHYIGIDISESSNLNLQANIKKCKQIFYSTTIITSEFEPGIEWVKKNFNIPNLFLCLGGTFGNFNPAQRSQFFSNVKKLMSKDDLFMLTFDRKKDPSLIQDAYYNDLRLEGKFMERSIARLNDIADHEVDSQKFWYHAFYDPMQGAKIGHIVSKEDQTISIGGKVFNFEQNEVIIAGRSQRFSKKQFAEIMKETGFEGAGQFQDDEKLCVGFVFKKVEQHV